MPDLKSLLLALDLATRRRDDAGVAVVQAQNVYRAALDQMQQLECYARETESNWALGSRTRTRPEIMLHYDQFMLRLEQAVDMQRVVVTDHSRSIAAARQVLLEAEQRMAGLKRLLEKRRAAIARAQSSREQKHMDELSAMQYRRRHSGSDNLGTP